MDTLKTSHKTMMTDNRPPPQFTLPFNSSDASNFITSDHPKFEECIKKSFGGFVAEPASKLPRKFHKRFRKALSGLNDNGAFGYDYTQPMGYNTSLARTRVRRCLVGMEGITYRYLGVRMFAHPWSGKQATKASKKLRKLSKKLEERSEASGALPGSSTFNLSLVNRMDPSDDIETNGGGAKPEKTFGMGQCSVSWHADSSLQDFSSISVYVAQHVPGSFDAAQPPLEPQNDPWKVALRVVRDVEGPSMRAALEQHEPAKSKSDDTTTPAVVLPLHDGDVYHMVGSFNHHHQHAVLQGKGYVRYSSTHRVSLEDGHTEQSIRRRAEHVLKGPAASDSKVGDSDEAKHWQEEQECLAELEFEWLRQWYGQGLDHKKRLGGWWNEKIAALEALWVQLEQLTIARFELLRQSARTHGGGVDYGRLVELSVILRGALTKRRRLRQAWAAREADPLLYNCTPIPCLFRGCSPPNGTLPEDLSKAIAEMEVLQKSFSAKRKAAKPCYQLVKFGNCSKGDACPFSHATPEVTTLAVTFIPKVEPPSCHRVSNDSEAAIEWPFEDTEFGDHYETPKIAYSDTKPLLRNYAKSLAVGREQLRVYDPYYCRGSAAGLLTEVGFPSVIHEKRDFYADITAGTVPEHDVLLTNPPYSSDHKERLFSFLLERQRKAGKKDAPFLLLLPAWSASKLAWRQLLWCLAELRKGRTNVLFEHAKQGERASRVGAFSEKLEENAGCFFICPPERYQFLAAVESRDEAPFDGVWFCGGWQDSQAALAALHKAHKKKKSKEKRVTTVYNSLADLRASGLLPAADEARTTMSKEDAARRKRALTDLDEIRRSDPNWSEKKRRKTAESRDRSKVMAGEKLSEDTKQMVLATPKACRHFFGLAGAGGCTRGDNCRFLHALP